MTEVAGDAAMTGQGAQAGAFRVYIAQSVDGCIATVDGAVEWLDPFPVEDFGFDAFMETIGTIVMGRASYDQARSFGSWPYAGKRTVVLSSRDLDEPPPGVERWHGGSLAGLADAVARSTRGDVWVLGGARTIAGFLDLGRIDRLEIFMVPVLLGGGIPLFLASEPRALRLIEVEPLDHGVVKLEYQPV